jgi:hypothetical protein
MRCERVGQAFLEQEQRQHRQYDQCDRQDDADDVALQIRFGVGVQK